MTADGKDEGTKSGRGAPPEPKTAGESPAPEPKTESATTDDTAPAPAAPDGAGAEEVGGRRKGLDPTRYGDWEKNGRAIDF